MRNDSVNHIRARQMLYALLSRLYLAPPDAALIADLGDLPGFAEHIANPTPDSRLPTPDSLAVEYERLFGRSVYLYESLYVDHDLMLNTAAAERVSALYAAAGYAPDPRAAGAPDHLGLELGCMAHLLSQGEADLAARCLREHLAVWAPTCLRALRRAAPPPLYLAAAALAEELILSDLPGRQEAGGRRQETIPLTAQESEEESGLNRVVRRLATPAEVGIFLSRADITALGRALQLPTVIGERFQMLRGLFEAAGQFEAVPALLAALGELLADERAALHALAVRHPAWEAYAQLWQDRLAAGQALLAEMCAQTANL